MNDLFVVPLTQGHFSIVDAADAPLVAGRNWSATTHNRRLWYAIARLTLSKDRSTTEKMHRVLMDPPAGMDVDHINGHSLDNRRANLRVCTRAENLRNQRARRNTSRSGYSGVRKNRNGDAWSARVQVDGVSVHVGSYPCAVSAAIARDIAAIHLHGEFAALNFPELADVFSTEVEFTHGR